MKKKQSFLILASFFFLSSPSFSMDKEALLRLADKIGKDELISQLKGDINSSIYALSPESNKDEWFKFSTGVKDTQSQDERALSIRALHVFCKDLFTITTPLTEKDYFQKCSDHGWLYESDAPGI